MSQVFVHSPYADFADTQAWPAPVPSDVGRPLPRLRLFRCTCGSHAQPLLRIPRCGWMRLFPFFRLYACAGCCCRVFRWRTRQRPFYGLPVYLPPKTRAQGPRRRA